MSSNLITQPYKIILDPTGGGGRAKPVANGRFYAGIRGLDAIANPRTDLAYVDESGTERDLASPLILNNSGAFVVSENDGTLIQPYMKNGLGYSVLIVDKNGEPLYSNKNAGDYGSLERAIAEYTNIVYKESGGNSAVDNMIAGVPIVAEVGDVCSTGGTVWIRESDSSGDITDFKNVTIKKIADLGAVDSQDSTTAVNQSLNEGALCSNLNELYHDGYNSTGGAGGSKTAVLDVSNGYIFTPNKIIKCIKEYYQNISIKADSTIADNWMINGVNFTSPYVPSMKVGASIPDTLPDDHFAYVNSGGKNHILTQCRVLSSDLGLCTYPSAQGNALNSIYGDVVLDQIGSMSLQIDSSDFGIFRDMIHRGVKVSGQLVEPSVRPDVAFLHGIRVLGEKSLQTSSKHNRIHDQIIDNFDNGISLQTGARHNYISATVARAAKAIQVKNGGDDDPSNLSTSVRNNQAVIKYNDVYNVLDGRNIYNMRAEMHGENCQNIIAEGSDLSSINTKSGLNVYEFQSTDVSDNAALLFSPHTRVMGSAEGSESNSGYEAYLQSSCEYSVIDIVSKDFSSNSYVGGNFNLISGTTKPKNSGQKYSLDGDGNIFNKVMPEMQLSIGGSGNIITTICKSIRDSSSVLHNTVNANIHDGDTSNPVILDGNHYTLNLNINSPTNASSAVSINGDKSSGTINVTESAIGCVVGGDRNNLQITATRADDSTAIQVNGDLNTVSVTVDGEIRVTGDNNVIIGTCRSLANTGSNNDVSRLKIV